MIMAKTPERIPMLMQTQTPNFSTNLIWRFQIRNHGKMARTKSVMAEYTIRAPCQIPRSASTESRHTKHTSSKHGIVDDGPVLGTMPRDAVVKLFLQGGAADKEGDGTRPHDGVDGDEAEPDQDLVPFLHAQTEQRKAKRRLGEGDAQDAKELAHKEELVHFGQHRYLGRILLDVGEVNAEAIVGGITLEGDGGY